MRKLVTALTVLFMLVVFTATACADRAVKAAEADFEKARKTYISAREGLVDAKMDSLLTFGKAEKRKATERVNKAKRELKSAKKAYKAALKKLHNAEISRDSKIDRSPWSDFAR